MGSLSGFEFNLSDASLWGVNPTMHTDMDAICQP